MLNTITLKNFRQHIDKTVTFEAGNTSLRGENEAGKTTVIEAAMYLMGGAKRCRNNDFVTWGAKKSQCVVDGTFTFNGLQVRAKRSPNGAEIYVPADAKKPTVTGQNEVNAWFAEQLGAPIDVIAKMSFADQQSIRGLLADDNSKAMDFIENMSGLDVIEWVIEWLMANEETGPTGTLDDRIASQQEQLKAEQAISYEATINDTRARLEPLKKQSDAQQDLMEANTEAVKLLRQDLRKVTQWADAEHNYSNNVSRAITEHSEAMAAYTAQQEAVAKLRPVDELEADLAQLRERQSQVAKWDAIYAVHRKFLGYTPPEVEWSETGAEGLRQFIADNRAVVQEKREAYQSVRSMIDSAVSRIATLEERKVVSSACGLCGKDVSEFPEVKSKNAEIQAEIDRLNASIAEEKLKLQPLVDAGNEAKENIAAGEAIQSEPGFPAALQFPDLFEIDSTFVPPRVKWIGPEIDHQAPREANPGEAIAAVEKALRARRHADTELGTKQSLVQTAEARITGFRQQLAEHRTKKPTQTEDELTEKISKHEQQMGVMREQYTALNTQIGELQGMLKSLEDNAHRHAALITRLKEQIAADEAQVAKLVFNNELINDLRKARPLVGNQLWNIVLTSVSTYLSRMRSETSEVTREGKVFLVNGKPHTSYSGSARDLMGLGMRIALTKTFVPAADMLILDEPFAACDAARTRSCLSFTAAAGFKQTIIITHEDQTDELFDHIVEV